MQTAREITRTSQNQREVVFDLPHHPTLGTGPLQTIPHHGSERLDLFQGLPGGMVTGQIEPCITDTVHFTYTRTKFDGLRVQNFVPLALKQSPAYSVHIRELKQQRF